MGSKAHLFLLRLPRAHPGQTRLPGPHLAAASIATGVAITLAELQFTVHACVPGATGAGVASLPTVGARCPILARGVVSTVVEICGDKSKAVEQKQKVDSTSRHLYGQPKSCGYPRDLTSASSRSQSSHLLPFSRGNPVCQKRRSTLDPGKAFSRKLIRGISLPGKLTDTVSLTEYLLVWFGNHTQQ